MHKWRRDRNGEQECSVRFEGSSSRSRGFNSWSKVWTGEWGDTPSPCTSCKGQFPLCKKGFRLLMPFAFFTSADYRLNTSVFSPICDSLGGCGEEVLSASKCNPCLLNWGSCFAIKCQRRGPTGVFLLGDPGSLSWVWSHFFPLEAASCASPLLTAPRMSRKSVSPFFLAPVGRDLGPAFCAKAALVKQHSLGLQQRKSFSPSPGG